MYIYYHNSFFVYINTDICIEIYLYVLWGWGWGAWFGSVENRALDLNVCIVVGVIGDREEKVLAGFHKYSCICIYMYTRR